MDSKPSGHSEQLMQYSNQSWEHHSTHQTRYGSPGIFPVVHLSKKSTPIRSITPNDVNMRMNVQESFSYHDKEYGHAVEDLSNYGNREICYNDQEANANKLLDVLKEISRKRIHPENEDLNAHTSSKQQRCAIDSSGSSVTNTAIQVVDVPPVINPITASLSSAHTYLASLKKKFKKKNRKEATPTTVQKHALTQTDNQLHKSDDLPPKTVDKGLALEKPVKIHDDNKESTHFSAVIPKFFNEIQFEAAKKSKLAMLLSPLTDSKAKLPPYQQEPLETNSGNELTHSEIKPTSIISPKNKPKHSKHVTFVIPEKENAEDTSSKNYKDSDVSSEIIDSGKDKVHDEHLQSTETPKISTNREKESNATTESTLLKESLSSSKDQPFQSTPLRAYSSSEHPFNSKSNTSFIANVPGSHATSTIVSMPSSNPSTAAKIGGFKYDFSNTCTFQSQGTGSPALSTNVGDVKSQFSHTTTNSNLPQICSPAAKTSMFSSSSPIQFSQVVDTFFNIDGNLKSKSKENTSAYSSITNGKFSPSYSNFGANTTVTSVGRSMLLSTGLGTSALVPTTAPSISSHTASFSNPSSMSSPKLNLDVVQSQPFGVGTINPAVSSSSSTYPSTGFNSPNFFNATPKPVLNFTTSSTPGHTGAATNFYATSSNNNASTAFASPIFGSTQNLPVSKGKSDEILPTGTTGFSFGKSLEPSVFSSNQFKPNANGPASGFGDNKPAFTESAITSNSFNTGINSKNVFGASTSNSIVDFSTASPQLNSLFASSPNTAPPQSPETFTFGASNMVPNTNMFGVQSDASSKGKFNLLNTTNASPSLNTLPNSAFSSVVPSMLASTTNSFCFATNTGFNSLTYSNAANPQFDSTTSRIFSIGSGASYPKSRTYLKGRRRT